MPQGRGGRQETKITVNITACAVTCTVLAQNLRSGAGETKYPGGTYITMTCRT